MVLKIGLERKRISHISENFDNLFQYYRISSIVLKEIDRLLVLLLGEGIILLKSLMMIVNKI